MGPASLTHDGNYALEKKAKQPRFRAEGVRRDVAVHFFFSLFSKSNRYTCIGITDDSCSEYTQIPFPFQIC